MTFILNLLNTDFSLLVSDRKGCIDGPVTLTMGKLTIRSQSGVNLMGVKKLYFNADSSMAFGFAGNTADHGCIPAIEKSGTPSEGMSILRKHMDEYLWADHRAEVAHHQGPYVQNQAIATFFDPDVKLYFSTLHLYSRISYSTELLRITRPLLTHIGSGSNAFEKAVGVEEIRRFAGSVGTVERLDEYLGWLKEAFKKVSAIDTGCGEEVRAVLSTKADPAFREIT